VLVIEGGQGKEEIRFSLTDFDRALVEAGGWVEYADTHY
jgi:3-isopropylmalate/(R)-2-methylmalate dehydratase small subunit